MKKAYAAALSAAAWMLSGCGGDASCRFEVQAKLDSGNYGAVIDKLAVDGECRDEYPDKSYLIDLGSAYMGKAGLAITDIMVAATEAADNGGDDTFGTFVNEASEKIAPTALIDLRSAAATFSEYLTYVGSDCSAGNTASSAQKDVCLYRALTQTLSASATFDYLTEDIGGWIDGSVDANATTDLNANDIPDDMEASACALEYAVNGGNPVYVCANNARVVSQGSVTFDNNRTYGSIEVSDSVNQNSYFYLVTTDSPASTVVTEGYCATDFTMTATTPETNASSYPCPVDRSSDTANELVVTELLVATLNSGLETALLFVDGDPELEADIRRFYTELGGQDQQISVQEMLDYLNKL